MTQASPNMLRVATSGDYPPFTTTSTSGYHGFDIDLAQLIAAKLGKGIEFRGFSWTEFQALQQVCSLPDPPIDMIASGITITAQRSKDGLFSTPYLRNRAVVLGPKSQLVPADLNAVNLTLGVNEGGFLESLARRNFPNLKILTTQNNSQLSSMTAHGADCIMTDSLEANSILRRGHLHLWAELEWHDIAIYMPKVRMQLCAEVDAILQSMLRDGALAACAKRHGIDERHLPQQ